VCSTERGTNTKGATRAGRKMVKVHNINISREMIGIGRLMHPSEIRELITGKLQEQASVIHYPIITQFWVLTGEDKCLRNIVPMSTGNNGNGILLFLF
jgi:hypothetical protein